MDQSLDDLLCQRYPDIFRDRHGTIYETGMCYGFCCGDGWYDIINRLCTEISNQVDSGTMPPVVARQVKEKFGSLRFYFRGGNNETRRLIELARLESEQTCEQCGRLDDINHLRAARGLCSRCKALVKT